MDKKIITIDTLDENLSFFDKMYEAIRIVDPLKKIVLDYKHKNIREIQHMCYHYWSNSNICDNCISMRAYNENDTFVKMEQKGDKLFMVTAIPVQLNDRGVVIELLKDVTNSMILGSGEYEKGIQIRSIIKDINQIAVKDSLTELFNRRYINERLPVDIIKSVIDEKPLSIIMADIDFFKNVNDIYGHVAGDHVIKELGKILISCIRSDKDWVARYGGEEYLICLEDTDLDMAYHVAERMRCKINNHIIKYDYHQIRVTLSFGVCSIFKEEITPERFIDCADKKLYEAKKAGRNKVTF